MRISVTGGHSKKSSRLFSSKRWSKIVFFERNFRFRPWICFILSAKIVQFVQIEFRRHHKYLMHLNFKSKRWKLLKSFVDFSSGYRSTCQFHACFWSLVRLALKTITLSWTLSCENSDIVRTWCWKDDKLERSSLSCRVVDQFNCKALT